MLSSEEETMDLGRRLAGLLPVPGMIALYGDLGAGKTALVRGIGEALGADGVTSPTFTIMKIYEGGRLDLYHYDAYRIEDPSEMEEIGYTDYFYGEGTCLIEWACNIEEYLPESYVKISIEKVPEKGFDYRRITVTGL